MFSILSKNPWLKSKNQIYCKVPSRAVASICGPPRFPMSAAKKIIIGGGSLLIMMIIPTWALLSIPSWAKKHQNVGKGRNDGDLYMPE